MENVTDATIRSVVNTGVEICVTDSVVILPPEVLVVKRVILIQLDQVVSQLVNSGEIKGVDE